MPTKRKHPMQLLSAAELSAIAKRVSQNSPWRKTPISKRSAQCHEYFEELKAKGDTRRVPRPELDVE